MATEERTVPYVWDACTEFSGLEVRVPAGQVRYPSIYEPRTIVAMGYATHGLAVPLESLPVGLRLRLPRRMLAREGHTHGGVMVTTRHRPEVTPVSRWVPGEAVSDPVDRLIARLQRLEACNLPRDRVFRECEVVATIRGQLWESLRRDGSLKTHSLVEDQSGCLVLYLERVQVFL